MIKDILFVVMVFVNLLILAFLLTQPRQKPKIFDSKSIQVSYSYLRQDTNQVYLLDKDSSLIASIYYYDKKILNFK